MALRLTIQEPPLTPPLHGFLTGAFPVDSSAGEVDRWMVGMDFRPLPEPAMSLWDPNSTGGDRVKSDPPAAVAPIEVDTFVVEAGYRESTWSLDWADVRRRARSALDVGLSWRIEQELWSGADFLGAESFVQAGATVLAPSAVSVGVGMALLSEALGSSFAGALGMIHLPAAVGYEVMGGAGDAVALTGRRLGTKARGDVVVIGSGYDGTSGPAGDTNEDTSGTLERWAFATPLYSYRLGPVEVIPDELEQALTKRTNTLDLRAEQQVGVYAASALADRVFAVRIDLTA